MSGSYRQIIRSSSIIGGASVVNVIVGMLRIKVAAVLLGPAGVGLIGLLTSLAGTASVLVGLGIGNVGTRQIAEIASRNDPAAMAAVRRAIFWISLVLALAGATLFFSLRSVLAVHLLNDASLSGDVGWLSLAVALTVASASQTGLLSGLRRVADQARVSVLSALLSALLGIAALFFWGRSGLIFFIIASPLAGFLVGHVYVARLPKIEASRTPFSVLSKQWLGLIKLGAAFTIAGLITTLGQLLVRTMVQKQLGPDALGNFQAASAISMTYIGFVLAAMGADYYPRLSAAIHDHAALHRMVNEQTEVALLLAGPVLLAMMGMAPWVIELLYTKNFNLAADVLRWQIFGDIFKVASWPLGFVILAAGDGRIFMVTESIAIGVFVLLSLFLMPLMGVSATGLAFFGMYIANTFMVYGYARSRIEFRWQANVWKQLLSLMLGALVVMATSAWSEFCGVLVGLILSASFMFYGFGRLAYKSNLTGVPGRMADLSRRIFRYFGF